MLIRTPWNSQPQGASVLDAQTVQSLGVTEVFTGSSYAKTLVNRFSTSGTNAFQTVNQTGKVTAFTAPAGEGLNIASSASTIFTGGKASILVYRRCKDTVNRASGLFGYQVSINDRILCHAPFTDGNIYFDYGNVTSGRISAPFVKTTKPEILVFVAGPNKGREIWRDGVKIASNIALNFSPVIAASPFYIGSYDTVSSDNDEIGLFVSSSSEWTDAQIASLTNNPWQLFQPLAKKYWSYGVAGGAFTAALTEASAGADSQSTVLGFATSLTEIAAAIESLSAAYAATASLNETAAGTHSQASIFGVAAIIAEIAAGTDAGTVTFGATGVIAEAGASTDTQTSTFSATLTLPENAAATDSQSAGGSFLVTLNEAAAGAETQSAAYAATVAVMENAAGTDTQTALAALSAAVIENAAATDVHNGSAAGAYNAALTEAAAGTETISNTAAMSAALVESAAGSDTVTEAMAAAVSLAETAAATHSQAASSGSAGLLTESATATEMQSAAAAFIAALIENAAGAETQTSTATLSANLIESASAADSYSVFNAWMAAIIENAAATDATNGIFYDPGVITESIFWAYSVLANNLHFLKSADSLRFQVGELTIGAR